MSQRVKEQLGAPRVRLPLVKHAVLVVAAYLLDTALWLASFLLALLPRRATTKPGSRGQCQAPLTTSKDGRPHYTRGLTALVPMPGAQASVKAELRILDALQNRFNKDVERVLVMIPGNPGHPEFYEEYMGELHAKTRNPCVIVGHTGHSPITASDELFSHFHQAEHKAQAMHFLRERYPKAKFVLMGHSIGAWIAMEMLRFLDQDIVHRVVNLFPTVHHIGTTPNGAKLYPLLRHFRRPASRLAELLGRLPSRMRSALVKWHLGGCPNAKPASATALATIDDLFHGRVVLQALYMACCEMEYLLDLDTARYAQYEHKLVWYYGSTDGWVTPHHAEDIKAALPKSRHIHCAKGFSHSFVVDSSVEMAEVTLEWLE